MNWVQYEADASDNGHIPIHRWGSDHWSTFAYLETRVVDANGVIDNCKMRCNNRLHRAFAHYFGPSSKEYPTRLKDGEQPNHDDWSCLEDMVAEGLVTAFFTRPFGEPCGGKARVELTSRGHLIAAQLRQHKGQGGRWGDFEPKM